MALPKREIIPPPDGWKERTYYVVDVAFGQHNPVHRAIFYTGFLNGPNGMPGGYESIWNPTYEGESMSWRRAYYLKAVSEIPDMDEQPLL
jgi:hypothetical protein